MTNEELLAVLDMSEELDPSGFSEQMYWVGRNIVSDPDEHQAFIKGYVSLADLAFRLRDEAVLWFTDFDFVYRYEIQAGRVPFASPPRIGEEASYPPVWAWVVRSSKPIHWILTAIKAKGLAKEHVKDETAEQA